ncbi:MAG TPA: hypothetical protein DDZ05_04075 [Candidatus Blackburnbacteria bacterium]|nr:hypothetical protein [Candidatus Blackburnbacteria bacterium]
MEGFLHNEQSYLGRCVVVLKTHKPTLLDVEETEWENLRGVIAKLAHAVEKGLGATMCNWACLMNDAYQEEIPAPHVHWHLRPRYMTKISKLMERSLMTLTLDTITTGMEKRQLEKSW